MHELLRLLEESGFIRFQGIGAMDGKKGSNEIIRKWLEGKAKKLWKIYEFSPEHKVCCYEHGSCCAQTLGLIEKNRTLLDKFIDFSEDHLKTLAEIAKNHYEEKID